MQIGDKFGRLKVTGIFGKGHVVALVCECGKEISRYQINRLLSGAKRSCGCFQKEYRKGWGKEYGGRSEIILSGTSHPQYKHGGFGTQMYQRWLSMKNRCRNPNSKAYQWYGARDITVCERWANDFTAFLRDVGPCPGKGYSLDRINNNGNYEPGNVRWATYSEQAFNKRHPKRKLEAA